MVARFSDGLTGKQRKEGTTPGAGSRDTKGPRLAWGPVTPQFNYQPFNPMQQMNQFMDPNKGEFLFPVAEHERG